MGQVTLIGKNLAKRGMIFTYVGPLAECRDCKIRNVCFNLKPGRTYEITAVRDKTHKCDIFEDGGIVVEVEEQPLIASVDKKYIEGSNITGKPLQCRHIGCPHHSICTTSAVQKNKTYTIKRHIKDYDCIDGRALHQVELTES